MNPTKSGYTPKHTNIAERLLHFWVIGPTRKGLWEYLSFIKVMEK